FSPMRPVVFRSPPPAIPTTSVENRSGATIILIRRMERFDRGVNGADADGETRQRLPPRSRGWRQRADRDADRERDEDLRRETGETPSHDGGCAAAARNVGAVEQNSAIAPTTCCCCSSVSSP